jgi:hypothetical protein
MCYRLSTQVPFYCRCVFLRPQPPSDVQELHDSMMAPSTAQCSNTGMQGRSGDESDGSSSSSSSVEGLGDRDEPAALLWLENLLPLPRSCCVLPAQFPLPHTMNSRILTASPDAKCSALLGYVQVLRTQIRSQECPSRCLRSVMRLLATRFTS